MELHVQEVPADGSDLVRVDGPGVSGWCVWPEAPGPRTAVDVELDVPDEVPWSDVEVGGAPRPSGPAPGDGLEVHAQVLDVDEQDVLTLRLPGGAILLVDTTGEPPLHVVGAAVNLRLHGVVVHPTHV